MPHLPEVMHFLQQRRSASLLQEPKPDRSQIEQILSIAGTVPDHGGLKPYRFVVIEGKAQDRFGEALVNAAEEGKKETLDEKVRPKIKAKAFASPLQILIIFSPLLPHKIPQHEQMAAASCTGYAMILGANALGFGAVWKSFAYDPGSQMQELLALKPQEKLMGWINIGTEKQRENEGSDRAPLLIAQKAVFLSY